MNAFHVIGGAFALWALALTAIGVRRHDFPRSGRQTFAVGAISALLCAGAVGSGIVTAALEDHEEGEEPAGEGGESGRLELSADPGGTPSFDRESLEAPAGRVTLAMENPSSIPHNVSIEGGEEGNTVGEGGTSTVTAELDPGEYTYYCSVPGHREAGMEGTLTVR